MSSSPILAETNLSKAVIMVAGVGSGGGADGGGGGDGAMGGSGGGGEGGCWGGVGLCVKAHVRLAMFLVVVVVEVVVLGTQW